MNPLKRIFVMGGELVVTNEPTELITILGSCVAVCIWDKKTKIAGMNHYLLPLNSDGKKDSNHGLSATRMLIKSMIKKMSSIKNLEARIFGGGNRFFQNSSLIVGPQNVEVAKKVLREAGIPIVSLDIGGVEGRKICFNTQTGTVTVLKIE